MERRVSTYRLGRGLLALWGTYQIGLGVYFLAVRPTLLPEDERAISSTLRDVLLAAPGFKTWINRVLSVLGGQALACGILLLSAVLVLRRRAASAWEIAVLATAGLPSVALMSIADRLRLSLAAARSCRGLGGRGDLPLSFDARWSSSRVAIP